MLGVMDESIIVRKGCLRITGGLGEGRRVSLGRSSILKIRRSAAAGLFGKTLRKNLEISTTPIIQEFHWSQWAWRAKERLLPLTSHSTGSGSGVPESLWWGEGQPCEGVGQ